MRNSPISCKPPPHSNWRDDCKTCPVCGEKYWPTETTTRKNWIVKKYCSNACNAKAGAIWRHQKPAAKTLDATRDPHHEYPPQGTTETNMRTSESCRFAAYYKVQFWNEQQLAWQDVQKQHPSADSARAAFIAKKKCRVMEVDMKGRRPLP